MNHKKRQHRRTYFLSTHRFPVLVEVGTQLIEGELLDRSQAGVGIELTRPLEEGEAPERIRRLYIGETLSEYCIEDLRLAQVSRNREGAKSVLHLACDTDAQRQRLDVVLNLLIEPQGSYWQCPARLRRLPIVSGPAHYGEEAIHKRIEWVEERMNVRLAHIKDDNLEPTALAGNIERYVGSVQIPIGIAGPVPVRGTYTNADIPVPIATTEGALVSSICRGAVVCQLAGGIQVQVLHKTMLRAPVFFCEDALGAINLKFWIDQQLPRIIEKAQSVSSVARVKKIDSHVIGTSLHVRFYYDTGDAAGQNMATICTYMACEWISEQIEGDRSIGLVDYVIEGNFSGDKKVNIQNFIEGRGTAVTASCHIKESVLRRVLRVDKHKFVSSWQAAEMAASHIGMVGSNTNFANVIAGIFTATGQDIGSVHESAIGQLKLQRTDEGVLVTAFLPSIVIGTVGGGTGLPTQKESLQIMGCYGTGKVLRFAEIIAATCLCLDLSTMAAVQTNEFVKAHESLGRNRPQSYLSRGDLSAAFFQRLVIDEEVAIKSVRVLGSAKDHGITTGILQRKRKGLKDILRCSYTYTKDGEEMSREAVLKLKSPDSELLDVGVGLARLSGEDTLPGLFETYHNVFGYDNSHKRELLLYEKIDPSIRRFCPEIMGVLEDPEQDVYAVLMEDLSGFSHIDTTNNVKVWSHEDIRVVLRNLAEIHATYFNRFESLREAYIEKFDAKQLIDASALLRNLSEYNARRFPSLFDDDLLQIYSRFIDHLDDYAKRMAAYPMTLSHNDFNTRNLCLRRGEKETSIVVYDWELCCFQNPQHDLIEFLVFVLDNEDFAKNVTYFTEFYMGQLLERIDITLKRKEFFAILHLNAVELAVRRFNLYFLGHNVARFSFLERVFGNLATYIKDPLRYLAPSDKDSQLPLK